MSTLAPALQAFFTGVQDFLWKSRPMIIGRP